MSTRWYPLYKHGAPQLRVFLPNFTMKLIRPVEEQPPNVVQFAVSMQMTKLDVKNYLEKIYNVKTIHVRTRIAMGKTREDRKGYVVKDEDKKYAYVTLPKEEKFEFPNLFPKEQEDLKREEEKSLRQVKQGYLTYVDNNKDRRNTPGWFAI